MSTRKTLPALAACLAAALLGCAAPAAAQEAAVLSKGSGPYFEAYLALQKALGRPVTPFDLSAGKPRLPEGLKAVVAFGAKAADLDYPEGVKVIFALAPGYSPRGKKASYVRICPLPQPAEAVAVYRRLQPDLRRLAVVYSPAMSPYTGMLEDAAGTGGVELVRVQLQSPAQLPDRLRSLLGKADAVWLLPDPALINKTSLSVLGEFSCSNKMPFYAPSAGLLQFGAAASFAPEAEETGKAAARALRAALAGEALPDVIHADNPALQLNRGAVERCALPLKLPQGAGR